jgi:hypothetical protein
MPVDEAIQTNGASVPSPTEAEAQQGPAWSVERGMS